MHLPWRVKISTTWDITPPVVSLKPTYKKHNYGSWEKLSGFEIANLAPGRGRRGARCNIKTALTRENKG